MVRCTFEAVKKLNWCLGLNCSHSAVREHELPGGDLRWLLPIPGLHRLLPGSILLCAVSVLNNAILSFDSMSVTLESWGRFPLPLMYILEPSIWIFAHDFIYSLSLVQSLKIFLQRRNIRSG